MKKWITLLLAAIMIFSMVACTANTPAEETPAQTNATENNTEDKQEEAGAENEQANAPEEEKHLRIGVIIGDSTQDYYNLGLAGIKSAIKEGDELIVYDCSQDISKQYDQINDLISQQVDAIVLAVINADAMLSGLELIHEAGIPCFGYDQQLSEEGTALVEGQIYISDYTIGYLGGQAIDILFFEENPDAKLPEDARIIDAVERISCEALNGFCENEVNLFLLALTDHAKEFCAFFCGRACDALIRENPSHCPFFVGHDLVGVILALGFVAAGLFFLFRRDAAVRRYAELFCDCGRLL